MGNPPKKTATQWRNHLDELCRQAVRKRVYCERCGRDDTKVQLQCAHIFTRTYKQTRWDLGNLLLLCASCHFWGHRNPLFFADFVRERLGEEKYKALRYRAEIKSQQWGEEEYQKTEKILLKEIYGNKYNG